MMTVTIEIPALDRLCAILEQRDRGNIVAELEQEIVKQLEAAAKGGGLEKAAKATAMTEVAPDADHPWKDEATTEDKKAKGDRPHPPAAQAPDARELAKAYGPPEGEGSGESKPATLADIQKAAAQMRDDGRLQEVKNLFPEFGIKRLSDLKGDQLQAFAAKLREMGARV